MQTYPKWPMIYAFSYPIFPSYLVNLYYGWNNDAPFSFSFQGSQYIQVECSKMISWNFSFSFLCRNFREKFNSYWWTKICRHKNVSSSLYLEFQNIFILLFIYVFLFSLWGWLLYLCRHVLTFKQCNFKCYSVLASYYHIWLAS